MVEIKSLIVDVKYADRLEEKNAFILSSFYARVSK